MVHATELDSMRQERDIVREELQNSQLALENLRSELAVISFSTTVIYNYNLIHCWHRSCRIWCNCKDRTLHSAHTWFFS